MPRKYHLPAALALAVLLIVAFIAIVGVPRPAKGQDSGVVRGEKIAQAKCARCHAIGRSDASPNAKAPPFRDVGRNYPPEHLAEALAEGIVTGDNDMPEFRFGPRDVDAIIDYLAAMSKAP